MTNTEARRSDEAQLAGYGLIWKYMKLLNEIHLATSSLFGIDEMAMSGRISPTSTYSVKYEQGWKQMYCCPLDCLRAFLWSL